MNATTLLRRSLRHYWRTNLAVICRRRDRGCRAGRCADGGRFGSRQPSRPRSAETGRGRSGRCRTGILPGAAGRLVRPGCAAGCRRRFRRCARERAARLARAGIRGRRAVLAISRPRAREGANGQRGAAQRRACRGARRRRRAVGDSSRGELVGDPHRIAAREEGRRRPQYAADRAPGARPRRSGGIFTQPAPGIGSRDLCAAGPDAGARRTAAARERDSRRRPRCGRRGAEAARVGRDRGSRACACAHWTHSAWSPSTAAAPS